MTRYSNQGGRSGVEAFEIRDKSIVIKFKRDGKYVYDYQVPGEEHVEEMKRLAVAGRGLSTYISQNVRKRFARMI